MHEDPAPTSEEHEQTPDRIEESQAAEGPGHEDDDLPGDSPPDEPIHES